MTNAAHTPGPWTYEYNPYTSQDGKEIPAFEVYGEEGEKVCDTNENRPSEEQEANARLIAVAPALLAVAKLALNYLDGQEYLQACATVASAEGGSL
jgi:hypothetical protein